MNEIRLDPILTQWLDDGSNEGPDHGLQRALAATRQSRQQSRWEFPRVWLPAPVAEFHVPRAAMIGLLLLLSVVLLIAMAVAFGGLITNTSLVLGPTEEVVAFSEAGRMYVVNPDGTNRRDLNVGVPNATSPVFSPDGTRIAFLASESQGGQGGRLFIAAVDGSGPNLVEVSHGMNVLPSDVPNVSWSSDSGRIAFAARAGANAQVFVVNRDGGGLTAITDGSAHSDLPSWSPIAEFGLITEDWIAYRVTRPDLEQVIYERVRPDGTAREVFTALVGPDTSLSKLTWSPYDPTQPGHRYVTTSYSLNAGFGSESRVVIDGGVGHQLDIWTDGTGGFPDAPVPWSPDSRYLAFLSPDGVVVGEDDRTSDMYDGEIRELGPVLDCWVDWSPNSQFLFGGAPNDCAGIVIFPLKNPSAATRLTNEPGTASWRPMP